MTVAVNILSQVYPDLVDHMTDEDKAYVAGALDLRRMEKGEGVLTYGVETDSLYMIAEGDLAISLPGPDGQAVDLGKRGAGRWVGELGVIEPGPASATVSAASDVTLWVLTHDAFLTMRKEMPCAAARIMEEVSKDVAARLRQCNSVLFRPKEGGGLEVVPRSEAPSGMLARLVHEIRDLLAGQKAEPITNTIPKAPLKPAMSFDTFLREHPEFSKLPKEERESLQKACTVRTFPAGHELIRQGDTRDSVYFLLDGQVEVIVHRPREASFAVDRVMGPGEIIGLIALVDHGKRSATCRCRGPVKAAELLLEGASFLQTTRAPISCAFQFALASQLARDARNLNESLLHAAAHPDA